MELGYLALSYILTTLSGNKGQCLQQVKELINNTGRHGMDELTRRMHLVDVENVLFLFHHVVDSDNTVIEHNHQVVQADYQHGSTCVIVI